MYAIRSYYAHVVLIDREGKVQYVKVGATDYDKTERKIQQLLAE